MTPEGYEAERRALATFHPNGSELTLHEGLDPDAAMTPDDYEAERRALATFHPNGSELTLHEGLDVDAAMTPEGYEAERRALASSPSDEIPKFSSNNPYRHHVSSAATQREDAPPVPEKLPRTNSQIRNEHEELQRRLDAIRNARTPENLDGQPKMTINRKPLPPPPTPPKTSRAVDEERIQARKEAFSPAVTKFTQEWTRIESPQATRIRRKRAEFKKYAILEWQGGP